MITNGRKTKLQKCGWGIRLLHEETGAPQDADNMCASLWASIFTLGGINFAHCHCRPVLLTGWLRLGAKGGSRGLCLAQAWKAARYSSGIYFIATSGCQASFLCWCKEYDNFHVVNTVR